MRRIHEGYEAEPPVYTAKEAEERIRTLRDLIARMETELQRLLTLLKQKVIGQKTIDMVRCSLEKIRDENMGKAGFSEKQELIARLGIVVYPSEDHRSVRIASELPVVGGKISTQIMSIASPKL